MRILAAASAALALFVACKTASAEDCTTRSQPAEQIKCLQETVTALSERVEKLATFARDNETLTEAHMQRLEIMMERKIREVTEPRLQHPF